jgi:hypothetical protein
VEADAMNWRRESLGIWEARVVWWKCNGKPHTETSGCARNDSNKLNAKVLDGGCGAQWVIFIL